MGVLEGAGKSICNRIDINAEQVIA